jgi:hypothetical protein
MDEWNHSAFSIFPWQLNSIFHLKSLAFGLYRLNREFEASHWLFQTSIVTFFVTISVFNASLKGTPARA